MASTSRPSPRQNFPCCCNSRTTPSSTSLPGQKDFVVTDQFTLPVDVDLLAIYPHAHYLGKDIQASATLPDGTQKTLIHIPLWNLSWQAVYRYAEPVFLPKGTIVALRYVYDNSADNPLNPNHPPVRVKSGNRSSDEMCHLWLQVLPVHNDAAQGDPRMVLQEALARHNIKNDPADFEAHYNLAAMLQAASKFEEAIREYDSALRLRPDDAAANNAMGAALLSSGQSKNAIAYLAQALKTRPNYFNARYNLGHALAAQEDFAGAAEQFRLASQLQPDDADAEANLGSALAEMGHLSEAMTHFKHALQLNPNHALAKENLQALERATRQ